MKYTFETKPGQGNKVNIEVSIGTNAFNNSHRTVECLIEDNNFHYSEALEETLLELINNTRLTVSERQAILSDAEFFAIYCHASIMQGKQEQEPQTGDEVLPNEQLPEYEETEQISESPVQLANEA